MNHIIILLDSVSYEIFSHAKTPNIESIGNVEEAYTPAHWTLPTITSMFYIPFYMGKPLIDSKYNKPNMWLPIRMKKCGYNTTIITDNPWFNICKDFISRGFDNYIVYKGISAKWIINEGKKHLVPPFFTFLFITETHHGDHMRKDVHEIQTKEHQVKAIEKVDNLLGELFDIIPKDTRIIITADHGDSYDGDMIIGHNPRIIKKFDKDLFRVPFITGLK